MRRAFACIAIQSPVNRDRSRLGDREDEHVAVLHPLEPPVRGEVVRHSA